MSDPTTSAVCAQPKPSRLYRATIGCDLVEEGLTLDWIVPVLVASLHGTHEDVALWLIEDGRHRLVAVLRPDQGGACVQWTY